MVFALFARKSPVKEPVPESAPETAALGEEEVQARIRDAERARIQGDLESARGILEELAQTNPEHRSVRLALGIMHSRAGEYGLAKHFLLALAVDEPENFDALRHLATAHFHLGELAYSMGAAERARALRPDDTDVTLLIGDIRSEQGVAVEAAREYVALSDRMPESPIPIYRLELLGERTESRIERYVAGEPRILARRQRAVRRLLVEHRKKGLDDQRMAMLLSMLAGMPEMFSQLCQMIDELEQRDQLPFLLQRCLLRVLYAKGEVPRLVAAAERSHAEHESQGDAKFILGHAWLCAGTDYWRSGWQLTSHTATIGRPYHHAHGIPIWEGQKLGNRKLLVYQDQGSGDAIMGFRLLPLLRERGIRFELWVRDDVKGLAAQIGDCRPLPPNEAGFVPGPAVHGCDFAITFFGLIGALYLGLEELGDPPVVRPAPDHAPELRERIRALPGVRIGLLYGGNPNRRDDWMRSVPEAAVRKLAGLQGVSWVNLMIDERPDRARIREAFSMTDPMAEVRDFHDTAAIVEELDAVVAVDASVAHVAGNLRKPLWVLAPSQLDWRWQIGEKLSPWWPTGKVMRCDAPGVWDRCLEKVRGELQEFIRTRQEAGAVSA